MESRAETSSENTNGNVQALLSFYSNYLYNRFIALLPASRSVIFSKLSSIYNHGGTPKRRRRRTCLPLPLPSPSTSPASHMSLMSESSPIRILLEDIMEHGFRNLHSIQKNLQFWQSKAEGSNAQRAYFMICQRGPSAFINGTVQLIRGCVVEGSGMQNLYGSASSYVSERITVLTSLRYSLAAFLAQVYIEIDRVGDQLIKEPKKPSPSHLVAINDLFLSLEASIGHFHVSQQTSSCIDRSYSHRLIFEKLPKVNDEGSQWTDADIKEAIDIVYKNLQKLDNHLSLLVANHRKPTKVTLYWIRYTCGVVGLSVCSVWLLRHSSLMGSSDVDNWIREAKDSTLNFWNDHVEQPILAIRNELFETFKKRQKGAMEPEEVQLTSDSLHRMLVAFSEQTTGKKFGVNASDQEMLEIVMARYEKELLHPIQGLVGGELVRALLIQVQKLKLDIEEAMLELDQILRANEINFAILAALPAFFLSLLVLMLVRAWFKQDTRAEGRGRVARIQRRLLIAEVERSIMQYENFRNQGLERDAQCMFGLVLYSLDLLYCAVERHARATGEWICLRDDILDLGKPGLQTAHKLGIISRMERVYDCLLPAAKRQ